MREIRRAQATDAEAIAMLYTQLVPDAPIQVLPEQLAQMAQSETGHLFVCEDEGEIIASALLCLCADAMFNRQPFALIENLIVDSHYQREGIGKSLLDHIEAFCLARDCSKIMLLTNSENRAARDFYSAMGYDPDAKLGFVKYRRYFAV